MNAKTVVKLTQVLKQLILKMLYPDSSGRVSHKLTVTYFRGFIQPDTDTTERYFSDWSSNARACFSATMAMVSRYFRPYDRRSASDSITVPWPRSLVCWGHTTTDWMDDEKS